LIRWENLWPKIASYFGMEVGPRQHIKLTEMMADKAKHDLAGERGHQISTLKPGPTCAPSQLVALISGGHGAEPTTRRSLPVEPETQGNRCRRSGWRKCRRISHRAR